LDISAKSSLTSFQINLNDKLLSKSPRQVFGICITFLYYYEIKILYYLSSLTNFWMNLIEKILDEPHWKDFGWTSLQIEFVELAKSMTSLGWWIEAISIAYIQGEAQSIYSIYELRQRIWLATGINSRIRLVRWWCDVRVQLLRPALWNWASPFSCSLLYLTMVHFVIYCWGQFIVTSIDNIYNIRLK